MNDSSKLLNFHLNLHSLTLLEKTFIDSLWGYKTFFKTKQIS